MILTALICSLFCSSVGLYFIHRFSRMALLENQLEVLFSQEVITIPHCYRLVDCFPSYRSGACQDCNSVHNPIHFLSIFTLRKPCGQRSYLLSLVCEVILFVVFYLFLQKYGLTSSYIIYSFMIFLFFMITLIDFRYYIIPDELNFLGVIAGLSLSSIVTVSIANNWIVTEGFFINISTFNVTNSLLGIILSAGILLSIAHLTSVYLGRDAMGGGDIKLTAFIGAFIGYKSTLIALALSSLLGSLFGIISMIKSKLIEKNQGYTMIAFGPYIIVATIIVMYFGETQIISYYEKLSMQWVHGYITP